MTPEHWTQVEELFNSALDLPTAERARFLDAACAGDAELRRQVEALIESDEQAGEFIESPVFSMRVGGATGTGHVFSNDLTGPTGMIGRRVGAYRLEHELGRGGMGVVYLAARADEEFEQQVAVKLVKRGMDTDFILRRFRNERQILASLDHPNVARLFDGGTTDDGLPYFVMEYIEGHPLHRYCDEKRLTVAERLELFRQVCAAVAYAHQKLIVHRDIKPGNILVTADGTPKLLDFGIAKILNPEGDAGDTIDPTATAMRMMTPKYASPEQLLGGPATAASDIYSLGVLLYELLTGRHPFRLDQRATPPEVARLVTEEDPARPSDAVTHPGETNGDTNGNANGDAAATPESVGANRGTSVEALRRELARGLDQIVLKAMHRDPGARYPTVEEFSLDLKRFLEGQPVSAPAVYPPARAKGADTGSHPTIRKMSIAVLPFKALQLGGDGGPAGGPTEDADTGQRFLGLGLADALITRLSNIRSITVRPTSSVAAYTEGAADAVAVGQQLAVEFVLDGRIIRVGERIRVTVQLVHTGTGAPAWAGQFDEKLTDILALQDSLSEQVAGALVPHLTTEERAQLAKHGTKVAAAYEAYLRGRYHWNTYTEDGFAKALTCYHEAVAIDPAFAAGYSGIADYYNWLGVYGVMPSVECFSAAKEAAARAAALDPASAEAYTALGFATLCLEWDWPAGERCLRRALELNPNYATAHHWYSFHLATEGRAEEAERAILRAIEIDPHSPGIRQAAGWSYYQAGRYAEAEAQNLSALEIDPNFAIAHYTLSRIYTAQGRHEEAVAAARTAVVLSGGTPLMLAILGHACAAAGRREEARGVLDQLRELSRRRFISPHYAALIHCALGETDESLALLEEAYEQRDAWLVWLRVDPVLAPLRFDPRFMSLVNRVRAGGPPPVADDSRTGAGDLARTLTGNDTARGRETTRRAAGETTRLTTETAATVPAVWRKALAALAALLLFVLAGVGVQRYLRGRVGGEEIKSVAVLPFANLGSDPDTEYLSDGITEHLINDLSRLPSLRVMARATAFTYKGRQVNAREAGREMNVAAVLVGQITKRDDSLVIQAELVNVADGSQIWGERYSRKLSDLPAVQQSIGNEILSQLRLKLTGAAQQFQARHHTEDAEAYQLYLKGEFHRNRATPEDLRRGVEFFKQSIARDPDYALAYAGLALAYRSLPAYSLMPPAEAYPLATAAAHRALSLDSTLAAAHVPLASIKFVYDWDYPGAEWELREALRLNPNSAEIHLAYANFLTAMERFEEAMREYRAAQQLDPLSINITLSTAWSLQMAGRFEEALALCAAALRRDPNHARAYIYQGEIFEQQGRYDESIAAFRKAKEKTGETLAEVGLGHAYAVAGRRAEALQILAGLQEQAARGEISPFWLAVIHAGLGDKDQAFAALEAAYKERSNWMPLIKIGRRLTPLHDDPRFADLLRRVRLAN